MRRKHPQGFKAKVAVEAIKGQKSLNEIASLYEVHPLQVAKWKKEVLEGIPSLLMDKRKGRKLQDPSTDDLYRQIGQLQVELEWLKKKSIKLR